VTCLEMVTLSAHAHSSEARCSAAMMQRSHAGLVVALALISARSAPQLGRLLRLPAALIALGVELFAAAIALRVLGGIASPRGMAPVGGTLTMIGWLTLLAPALWPGRRG